VTYDVHMTKTLPASEVTQNFDAVLKAVAENGDEVLVEKGGRVVALLVPAGAEWESSPRIKKVSAADFRQNCVAFIDAVVNGGGFVLVEKDARVVARLVAAGPMYGTIQFEGDILSPVTDPDDWTADEDNLLGIDRPLA